MPPDGYQAITVDDETFKKLTEVMIEYECDSVSEAVTAAATIALEQDEADIARLLADRLES